jgi:hypothetical protein
MTARRPTQAGSKDNGGGYAAADLVEPAKDTGPPLGPPGCFASRCARHAYRRALDPRASATPGGRKRGQAQPAPPARGLHKISHPITSPQPTSPRYEGIDATITEAARVLGDAAPQAHLYPRLTAEFHTVRALLQPWAQTQAVTTLDDQLQAYGLLPTTTSTPGASPEKDPL